MTPIPQPEKVDLVIYHAPCTDGFTAAWAAWKLRGNSAEYCARPPNGNPPDVRDRHVAILDMSFPREILEKMTEEAKSLIVLDHHKTNRDDLKGFLNASFDMTKSGALLAWEWFHPDEPVPELVRYVSDRDLWTFQLPNCKEVHAMLGLAEWDFKKWDETRKVLDLPNTSSAKKTFFSLGKTLLCQISKDCESIAEKAELIHFDGVAMWATNYTGRYNSDVAEILKTKEADDGTVPGVVMTWFHQQSTNSFICSLRSRTDEVDVSAIAKKYGGGGHVKAAGFEWNGDIREIVGKKD